MLHGVSPNMLGNQLGIKNVDKRLLKSGVCFEVWVSTCQLLL